MSNEEIRRCEMMLAASDDILATDCRVFREQCDRIATERGQPDAHLVEGPEIPADNMGTTLRVCQKYGLRVAIEVYGEDFIADMFVDLVRIVRVTGMRYGAASALQDKKMDA